MKKIKYGILCLAAAAFMVCMTACGRQDGSSQTQQNQTNTGGAVGSSKEESSGAASGTMEGSSGAGTDSATTEAELNRETKTEGEGGGAGSTGSTEGETGVIDGLIRDAEDGVDDILDGGQNGEDDMGRGPGYESSGTSR